MSVLWSDLPVTFCLAQSQGQSLPYVVSCCSLLRPAHSTAVPLASWRSLSLASSFLKAVAPFLEHSSHISAWLRLSPPSGIFFNIFSERPTLSTLSEITIPSQSGSPYHPFLLCLSHSTCHLIVHVIDLFIACLPLEYKLHKDRDYVYFIH